MAFKDYYKLLEIRRDASPADIRKAFKKAAQKYHPDVNPGNAAAHKKFQELTEARDVLCDAEKRKMYDLYADNWDFALRFEHQRMKRQWNENDFKDQVGRRGFFQKLWKKNFPGCDA
jgi:curved DNA-binding protein